MFPFDPPESIRKPKVFWCFQGDQKETLGRKWLISFVVHFPPLPHLKAVVPLIQKPTNEFAFPVNWLVSTRQEDWSLIDRISRWQMFFKIGVLKDFANFTGKHQCWSRFLIKLTERTPTLKEDSNTCVFLWRLRSFWEQLVLKNYFGGCFIMDKMSQLLKPVRFI